MSSSLDWVYLVDDLVLSLPRSREASRSSELDNDTIKEENGRTFWDFESLFLKVLKPQCRHGNQTKIRNFSLQDVTCEKESNDMEEWEKIENGYMDELTRSISRVRLLMIRG